MTANLSGTVMGGTQPVSAATVTLYEAGTAPGASPTMLGGATTDSSGSFSINYANPGGGTVLYVLADGGNGGNGGNGINPDIELATAFSAATPPASVTVDELTTVATGYALSGFFSGGSFSDSAGRHLALALAPIGDLVDIATGGAGNVIQGTSNGAATTTEAKFNALADALANCVQTSASAPACQNLMADATPSGAAAPVDTLQAVVDIARNPAHNVGALLALAAGGPYTSPAPAIGAHSLMLALRYTGGGLYAPYDIAVDGNGNVWATNFAGDSVTELAPSGTAISPSVGFSGGGLKGPSGIAVDPSGHVWAADHAAGTVTELAANGTPISPVTGFVGGGLAGPANIAFDHSGDVWVTNRNGNSVTELASNGTPLSPSGGFTGGGLNQPIAIAVDGADHVWVTNATGNSITELASDGTPISPIGGYTGGGLNQPFRMVIDHSGRVWVVNIGTTGVTVLAADGTPVPGSPFTGGGLNAPDGIALDNLGDVWVANFVGNSITELAGDGTPLSPSTGFTGGGLNEPRGVAVDGAGNLWVANFLGNSVVEFIGAGAAE
ncbi:MAG: virginiamycin B lyase family protein [Gammaproteobacteria bacterium]|nr:hypothetical protein [Gammaproteobacteria bacterium]